MNICGRKWTDQLRIKPTVRMKSEELWEVCVHQHGKFGLKQQKSVHNFTLKLLFFKSLFVSERETKMEKSYLH